MQSIAVRPAVASHVEVTDDRLIVTLTDGRTLLVPVSWYPRLAGGAPHEHAQWELIGGGTGIHWPLLDEDICVQHLLDGRRSEEGEASLAHWRVWVADRRRADAGGESRPPYSAEIVRPGHPHQPH